MKVVVDTNVLVSGLLFGGVPGQILTAWTAGEFVLVVSPSILSEYRRVGRARGVWVVRDHGAQTAGVC